LDGIGAVGTLVVGILLYGEPAGGIRLGSAGLIVLGIIGLKLAHDNALASSTQKLFCLQ
jgi:quaternary ammonium compound-resistance protein SugE